MGRGRGKGRKQSAVADHNDTASGEDEKLPMRRRGRPQKPLKGEVEEEEKIVMIEKEDDHVEETKKSALSKSKSKRNQAAAENGRKRKRASHIEENAETVKEENGVGAKASATDLIKSVGYRPNGSRRKSKPRRAAEVGVECQ